MYPDLKIRGDAKKTHTHTRRHIRSVDERGGIDGETTAGGAGEKKAVSFHRNNMYYYITL